MIIVFLENLDQILERQMEEQDVKRLRSIFQEEGIFVIIATSPMMFDAVSQNTELFFHFFEVMYLKELKKEEMIEMIRIINEFEGRLDDLGPYYRKIDSIVTLTGGNPRIVILLYDLMCKSNILEVENAFYKILDEYTPYYQDLFKILTGQKRRIFDILISMKKPSTPKEIAATARLDNSVVVTQLRRLEKDGYVVSHRIGRNVKYEVKERLFRLWREQRQPLGRKRISILIEFIKLWYTSEEREKELLDIINHLESDTRLIKKVEYFFYTLSEESKSKLLPKITREFCECGIPELLEDLIEKEDEEVKRAIIFEKFNILLKNKEYEDLLEETEKRIREKDDDATVLYFEGHALLNLERYEEALQTFDRVLEINSDSDCTWCRKGWALLQLNRYEEALQAFDRVLEAKVNCPGIWNSKGVTFGSLERYEDALHTFDRALEIDSGIAGIWYNRGRALVNLERYEDALHTFDRALEIDSGIAGIWYNRGRALVNLERYEEALHAFDRALEIDPKNIGAYYFKGIALENLERYEEALHTFDRALEIDSGNAGIWYNRGRALVNLERYEDALHAFDRALEIDSGNSCVWCSKGTALVNLERYEDALHAFDRALEIDPSCNEISYFEGFALVNLERYEDALHAFDRALEDNSENVDAMLEKGTIHLEISVREFKKDNYGNAVENLKFAMDSFLKTWNTKEEKVRERIIDFFKNLTDLRQANAVEISFITIIEKNEELAEFLKPISVAVEIARTKDLKKYYDLQIEQREIVVDVVKRLTESEEFLPEEYRKGKSHDEEFHLTK
jgi:hypothetical protein